jgi:hypothetical protein
MYSAPVRVLQVGSLQALMKLRSPMFVRPCQSVNGQRKEVRHTYRCEVMGCLWLPMFAEGSLSRESKCLYWAALANGALFSLSARLHAEPSG